MMKRTAVARLLVVLLPASCAASPRSQQPLDGSDGAGVRAAQSRPLSAAVVGFPQYPSVSPDGSLAAFSWAGDIWVTPIGGGYAQRATAHPADERRSAFSPDGRSIAFESDRDGARNLYVADLVADGATGRVAAGPARRVTVSDRVQTLGSWTADGEGLLLSAAMAPTIYRAARMYVAPLDGGPVEELTGAFGQMPRASGDGSAVAFTRGRWGWERPAYRGSGQMDLWVFRPGAADGAGAGAGGRFERITEHAANDGDGWVLPDGSAVFVSSRDGQNNVWRIGAGKKDRDARQLTRFGKNQGEATIGHGVRDLAVSRDGSVAVFCVWDTLYRLDLTDRDAEPVALEVLASADDGRGETQTVSLDREVNDAALSPDGKTIAVSARGEVLARSTEKDRPTRRVTETMGREGDVAWSADNTTLYFSSDEGHYGRRAIYGAKVALSREDLAPPGGKKKDEEKEEEAAAEEEEETPDAAEGGAAEAEVDEGNAEDAPPANGEKKDEPKKKEDPKAPDEGKRWAESLGYELIEVVADAGADVRRPMPSPDGKKLLYLRGLGDLYLRDLETGADRRLFASWDEPDVQWAGDSRHIVYAMADLDFNTDIWLLDTGEPGTRPVNLTRHPDNDVSPRLSRDGKVLVFLSDRGGENWDWDVWAVYLDRSLENMEKYELDAHFEEAAKAMAKLEPAKPLKKEEEKEADEADEAGGEDAADDKKDDGAAKDGDEKKKKDEDKPVEPYTFDAEDAYLRVRRLSGLPGSESNLAITAAGDRVIFSAEIEGSQQLASVDHRGEDRKTISPGPVSNVTTNLKGDKVVFVRTGTVSIAPSKGGKVDAMPVSAMAIVSVEEQQRQKFAEAAAIVGNNFYHPTLKGLDWPALKERYGDLAARTRTADGFNRVVSMLFGELEGSHLGIWGGDQFSAPSARTGYLGVDLSPGENGYKIERVLALAAAATGPEVSRLAPGETIIAVDGRPVEREDGSLIDFGAAMAQTAGRETVLTLQAPGGEPRRALIVPHAYGRESSLRYQDEVMRRREMVETLSGGRLGYVHIQGMSMPSVRDFERDLYAAAEGKAGLIIDVRDNGGGSTTDILLSSLTAPKHAYTVPRGADEAEAAARDAYPRDRRLIYGYGRPINVLMNENSFSNAEIFAHAIKTIGRGKLVGTATFGGVISTGAARLIDGTTVRVPFRGWYLPGGIDMENHGAQPDVAVAQTPEDEAAGVDRQLEAAVEELLGRVGGGR